ncbi:MAG: hypothetical protein PHQ80_04225 [Candidatus ainarchaeum sp.]|nr:hypothetical protein [Candidatus ainarchaeum sp.]MDD5096642.1 hypothetical protein [Candidatus ainarchaeum sp.]
MKFPSTLGKMRAGSLPSGFYGELEEFFSSVRPSLAITGGTSLLTLCRRLHEAKTKGISAKRTRDAERMIKAICAAAEIRGIRYGKLARQETRAAPGSRMAAERRPMREGIGAAGQASVPKEIIAQRARVANAAEKAGILPPDLDYRATDLRHMAARLGLG